MKKQVKIILPLAIVLILIGGYYMYQKNSTYNKAKSNQTAQNAANKNAANETLKKNAADEIAKAEKSKSEKDINSAKQAVGKLPEGADKRSLNDKLSLIADGEPVMVSHKTRVKPSLDVDKKTMIIVQLTNAADDKKYDIFYNNQRLTRLDAALYSIDVKESVSDTQAEPKIVFKPIKK
ncbi:hypothetical protein [Clostridium sp. JS66]|uniref:hypothetical protein n=1 Tax=Clostridium sp. JS66 TaxID=3064705 RepID=UPI00298EA50E|nr:hypothetical protein [Clostridium sp. JS66]WPC42248.1 hypothetical protein Q6H37_01860 [Clostridium sp. JS66]